MQRVRVKFLVVEKIPDSLIVAASTCRQRACKVDEGRRLKLTTETVILTCVTCGEAAAG